MNLGLTEHVYKYYIHHGVSVYLVASRDICNPELWQVNVKNLYTPGKDLGFGSCPNSCNNCYSLGCRNDYCVCPRSSRPSGRMCSAKQIQQKIPGLGNPGTGIDRSTNIKMTTSELERLMRTLDTSNGINIKQGNIILY